MRFLHCLACAEVYKDPRQLPCGHTFCLGCIPSLVDNTQEQLICLLCAKSHPTAGAAHSDLPLAADLGRIISSIPLRRCDRVGCSAHASAFCETGCGLLCDACLQDHIDSNFLGGHCVRKTGGRDVLCQKRCIYHPQCNIAYVDLNDNISPFKCIDCIMEKGINESPADSLEDKSDSDETQVKSPQWVSISSCVDDLSLSIEEYASHIKSFVEKMNAFMDDYTSNCAKIRSDGEQLRKKIDIFFVELRGLIETMEMTQYRQLDEVVAQSLRLVQEKQVEIAHLAKTSKYALEASTEIVASGKDNENPSLLMHAHSIITGVLGHTHKKISVSIAESIPSASYLANYMEFYKTWIVPRTSVVDEVVPYKFPKVGDETGNDDEAEDGDCDNDGGTLAPHVETIGFDDFGSLFDSPLD